jgi:branched-chain amino acid aminotransferase
MVIFIFKFALLPDAMELYGNYYYLDGNILKARDEEYVASGDVTFYEVIRTRKGIPMFFDDHVKRLADGISTRYDIRGNIAQEIKEGLDTLAGTESFDEINVRVTVSFSGQEYSLHLCYISSFYPSDEMISAGAHLILYHAERFDPGVKILNDRLRLSVGKALQKKDGYEALLVNHEGYITEGSRSNVFFVASDRKIYTAPDSMVLSGITRKHVITLCQSEGIEVVSEPVRADNITQFQSVFITGTSPMVLAARSIEDKIFGPFSPVIEKLRKSYSALAEKSISKYRFERM